ncbi:hypothetical protein SCD_n00741 [Sulfuricella denitrificans skB26]|uniref:Uncharacterized protein n=1 Tax=Sulfuricella denitrificans (strain DSM 22764 / NBRC 105220 / skB26) TaxID=1163617 RepID=S6ABD2_SULDS|nr:hypothetical protein [Sulfuricella denitrificans]BAN34583.1 hypothetical protein SCD_n00741 [Sulfuricella denitrificans skB26]
MKDTLIAMYKFNIKMVLVFLSGTLLFLIASGAMPNSDSTNTIGTIAGFSTLIFILFTTIRNIQILWNGRRKMLTSMESAAIEATATAIEFKEKADSRVQERIKERQRESKNRNE